MYIISSSKKARLSPWSRYLLVKGSMALRGCSASIPCCLLRGPQPQSRWDAIHTVQHSVPFEVIFTLRPACNGPTRNVSGALEALMEPHYQAE